MSEKDYETLEKKLKERMISSDQNEIGYSQKYNGSFLNGAFPKTDIIQTLKDANIMKNEKINVAKLTELRKE